MNIQLKCLPVGKLPYNKNELVTKMMIKLFEQSPYLPLLPNISENDTLVSRTLSNIPGIKIEGRNILFKSTSKRYAKGIIIMDALISNPDSELLEEYKSSESFLKQYLNILKRIQPKETVINLLGPFSLSQMIKTTDEDNINITDKGFRRFLYQIITIKALWFIRKIHDVSPDTTPIIVLEEPLFNEIGKVKKQYEDFTGDVIAHLMSKIIQTLHNFGARVCIQSFKKCDWQIPIEAGADMISFDAYNNPYNLSIIPDKVNHFLAKGGRINWAIVPTTSENVVKSISTEAIALKLQDTIEALISSGVSERLAYNHATASIQGDIDNLPLIFAEKALIVSTHVANRIPQK